MIELHVRYNRENVQGSLATVTCGFASNIALVDGGKKYNAKSIMNIPLLNQRNELYLVIEGPDENKAAEKIIEYYES
ncbi:MAG: HPr family phosphocarrier protein [Lachnospiraceae bacterium]|nr:HPr family phosphocarrier protein [Lachnospiraceae bacterium]